MRTSFRPKTAYKLQRTKNTFSFSLLLFEINALFLYSLLSMDEVQTEGSSSINEIELSKIAVNPNQPRREFDPTGELPLPGHHLAVLVGRTVGELHRFARHDLLGRPREVGHGPYVVVHDPNGLLERRLLRPAVGGDGQLDDILSGLIVGDVLRGGFVCSEELLCR